MITQGDSLSEVRHCIVPAGLFPTGSAGQTGQHWKVVTRSPAVGTNSSSLCRTSQTGDSVFAPSIGKDTPRSLSSVNVSLSSDRHCPGPQR